MLAFIATLAPTSLNLALAEPSAQLNRFSPSEQSLDGFVTRSPETQGHLRFGAQLYIDYGNHPLDYEQDGGPNKGATFSLVKHQVTGNLNLSLGISDHFTAFVGLPIVLMQQGDQIPASFKPGVVNGDGSSTTGAPVYLAEKAGPGDIFLGGRARIYGTTDDVFMLGASARLTLPLANLADSGQHYRGEQSVSAWPELLMQLNFGRVRALANVGILFRDKAANCEDLNPPGRGANRGCFPGIEVNHELTYALGVTGALLDSQVLRAILEVHGRSNLTNAFSSRETPIELLAGLKYIHTSGIGVGAGGGPGVQRGFGSPDFRLFAMVGYTQPAAPKDTDHDGLLDNVDACPTQAEDNDGYEDADGCPELDNDGDGIADAADGCALTAEDKDGFEDADGCPDADNDADGIADNNDRCMNEAEDADGFEDTDGCPDTDNDGDGVADPDDKCPVQAGPSAHAGCPLADADGDGVADAQDSCPNEAGTAEFHGCPKASSVVVIDDQLQLVDKIFFDSGLDTIQARSFGLLDDVARVIKDHTEIKRMRVEGHTDATGSLKLNMDLSKRRAAQVMTYLLEHGVSAERLESEGYGPTRPLVENAKDAAERAKNRRVDFRIIDRSTDGGAP